MADLEFGAATTGIMLAHRRTRGQNSATGTAFRWLFATLAAGYPLLAVAYLTDRLGAFVEPVFFGCFSAAVLIELLETCGPTPRAGLGVVAKDPGSCSGLGVG